MRKEFLLPTDMVNARGEAHFRTLLGSCVSVCLSNVRRNIFAMNHFMLPTNPGRDDVGRYGDTATDRVVRTLMAVDPDVSHYWVGVYGGASVTGHLGAESGIGERNVKMAIAVLRRHGLVVRESDVGGRLGRKVDFWTAENRVHCRSIEEDRVARMGGAAKPSRRGQGLRVLVVDDSAAARAVIRAGLEQAGMHVIGEAANAFDARELIVRDRPDVVTLDLEMPMINGLAFLRQLNKHFPLPVVVVSSSAPSGSERAREVLEAGAQAVVDKADLDMSRGTTNVGRVLVPRVKLAGLSRLVSDGR
ncbi:MAG: response regulator [Myxococcales bacterium]|nr:response regulator [Myxococcales bacterium]